MIRSERLAYGFIFAGIWGVFVVIDRYIVGMGFPYLAQDLEDGWFAIGLNWLTLEPNLWSRRPSPLTNQISGLVMSFLNIDRTDKAIEQFTAVTIALQGVIAFVAGVWFSWASNLIALDRWQQALLIVLVFTCPTLVYLSGHWTYSYGIGLLGLPLGLTLFGVFQDKKEAIPIGGFGIGLLTAEFYLSALILALFVFIIFLQKHRAFVQSFRQRRPYTKHAPITIALLGVCATAFSFGVYFSGLPIPDLLWSTGREEELLVLSGVGPSILFGLALWLMSSFLVLLLGRANASIERFLLWAVGGFIAGNFALLPWYFHGLVEAGIGAIGLTEAVNRLVTTPLDHPWLFVVWFSAVMLFLLSIYLFGKGKTLLQSEGFVYGAVFALVGTIVIALVGASALNPLPDYSGASQMLPGMATRLFLGAIPALTIGWIILFRTLHGSWLRICQVTLVLLSLISLGHFYPTYLGQMAETKSHGSLLDEAIEAFFEGHPNGRVVCVTYEFASRYCSTAVAYNRYRDFTRLKNFSGSGNQSFFPTSRLFDGRVIGLNIAPSDQHGNWDYDIGEVEKRLSSCSASGSLASTACYDDYVRSYADLIETFNSTTTINSWIRKALGRYQSMEQWGRSHYDSFGKAEGRTLPSPLDGPLFVITQGGDYRDNLIQYFAEIHMKVLPFWEWWAIERNWRGETLTEISPGASFLAFRDVSGKPVHRMDNKEKLRLDQ